MHNCVAQKYFLPTQLLQNTRLVIRFFGMSICSVFDAIQVSEKLTEGQTAQPDVHTVNELSCRTTRVQNAPQAQKC